MVRQDTLKILILIKRLEKYLQKKTLTLDLDKLREEEALDGYYVIVTSEYKETYDHIIEMYSGLWKIEESFWVKNGDLEACPVFVSREAHFLTCSVALVISRILEMKLSSKCSISKIL